VVSAITVKPAITSLTIPNVNWKPVINWKVNFFHTFCDAISEISSRRIFLGFWYVIIHDITSLFWKNQLYNIFFRFFTNAPGLLAAWMLITCQVTEHPCTLDKHWLQCDSRTFALWWLVLIIEAPIVASIEFDNQLSICKLFTYNWAYMRLTLVAQCGSFVQLMALWRYMQLSKDENILPIGCWTVPPHTTACHLI